ncbi:MAG TPA: hypothetical protein VGF85_10455 [Opitutaceae bacterium]|jgi:hypothetical protein
MMNPTQRQAVFNRFLTALARGCAEKRGLGFAGTLRKLPPPPLPGESSGDTRYYLNAIPPDGAPPRLIELKGAMDRALRRAEEWLESGRGPAPSHPAGRPRSKGNKA